MLEPDYKEYFDDTEIARTKLQEMMLYPQNAIADFYCLPSGVRRTYYAMVSKTNDEFFLTYITPQTISTAYPDREINIWRFKDCLKAEKKNPINGRFIAGRIKISSKVYDNIEEIGDFLKETTFIVRDGICIDGDIKGMRILENETVIKQLLYSETDKLSEVYTLNEVTRLHVMFMVLESIINTSWQKN